MNALVGAIGIGRDIEHGGAYRITGTVDELGVPGKYQVRLFSRRDARFVRQIWSAEDGSYEFQDLAYRDYFIVAHDHGADPVNAAIADYVVPDPMP